MTSPNPISIFNPICSYCWKESVNPIFFKSKKGNIHWACCKKHKKDLLEDDEEDLRETIKYLIEMYLEVWKENNFSFIKKLSSKLNIKESKK